jgi:hypothetical protein
MKIDNIVFGKEIKDLNILTNPKYELSFFLENKMPVRDVTFGKDLIRQNIERYKDILRTNIKYITKPIIKAWETNETKLVELMPNREDRGAQYGIFIYQAPKTNLLGTNYFYIDVANQEVFSLTMYKGVIFEAIAVHNGGTIFMQPYRNSEHFMQFMERDRPPDLMDGIDIQLELHWLLNYVDIDIKSLNKRSKIHTTECVYENHTNNDIQIITCAYFNKLEKEGAFNVRGHLRWQAYGEGFKDHKLIWIKDFQKQGYTRQAGKIREENA